MEVVTALATIDLENVRVGVFPVLIWSTGLSRAGLAKGSCAGTIGLMFPSFYTRTEQIYYV